MAVDPNAYTRIANAMTQEQRDAFLDRFTSVNPHYRGAHVDDVLAELANADSNLDVVEPFFDAHPDLSEPQLVGAAIRALLWSDGEPPGPGAIFALVSRA